MRHFLNKITDICNINLAVNTNTKVFMKNKKLLSCISRSGIVAILSQ